MKVRWTRAALADRDAIWTYVVVRDPLAAVRLDQLFSDAAERLADFPEAGRPGVAPGTRELIPHETYRLVYSVEESVVWVLALAHAARQWPPLAAGEGEE